MSDNNPRLEKWLNQAKQAKYKSDGSKNSHHFRVIHNESVLSYVGFWRRLFAKIIDWIFMSVFVFLVTHFFLINVNSGGASIVLILIWFFYYTICPSTHLKGTIGKLAVGAVIVDKNGKRLSYLHSIGRFFASLLSGGILFIGYIMVASNPKKRGLHDMMADTYVVDKM
jgi:uncharacterized RDD family membrane protein YckC